MEWGFLLINQKDITIMATFPSKAYLGNIKFRPLYEYAFELESTVKIPAGRTFANADVLKFFKVGANVDFLEVFVRSDKLEDGAGTASTIDVGTSIDPDCFIDGGTFIRGGGTIKVENGGDDPFATTPYVVQTAAVDVQATLLGTATQTTADDADRFVTLRAVMQYKDVPTFTDALGWGQTYDNYFSTGTSYPQP